jgi:hypothetical protein
MTAHEFEQWIFQRASIRGVLPDAYCTAVIDRLKADQRVTDRALLRCVEAHIASAEATTSASREKGMQSALQFIDQIMSLLPDRIDLQGRLVARKASLAGAAGDHARAAQWYAQSLKVIEPVRLEADHQRLVALVNMGQSLLAVNRKADAESAFLLALSYPWYTIRGYPEEMQRLRDQYFAAGRGLIEARRGNLAALQQIVFVPSALDELGPILQTAIREAGK